MYRQVRRAKSHFPSSPCRPTFPIDRRRGTRRESWKGHGIDGRKGFMRKISTLRLSLARLTRTEKRFQKHRAVKTDPLLITTPHQIIRRNSFRRSIMSRVRIRRLRPEEIHGCSCDRTSTSSTTWVSTTFGVGRCERKRKGQERVTE